MRLSHKAKVHLGPREPLTPTDVSLSTRVCPRGKAPLDATGPLLPYFKYHGRSICRGVLVVRPVAFAYLPNTIWTRALLGSPITTRANADSPRLSRYLTGPGFSAERRQAAAIMRDPFFIKPIPWLSEKAQPWADYFSLPTLPLHIHEVLFAALVYSVIFYPISPLLSNWLTPTHYSKLPRKRRLNWDAHVVSMFQSILINGLAIWVMLTDDELKQMNWEERVWGYTGGSGFIQAFAAGYFLWDLVVTSLNFDVFGIGTLAHAIAALFVYSLGFRPFVNYYACVFILWELSTPFLNVHWFMDKLNMTGSRAQLYNGLMLLFTFFSCRLVYGTYSSFCVFHDIWSSINVNPSLSKLELSPTMLFATQESTVPLWLGATYLLSNLTLNGLNFYWFFMMIRAVRKRFEPPKTAGKHPEYITEVEIEVSPVASGVEKPTTNGRRRKA